MPTATNISEVYVGGGTHSLASTQSREPMPWVPASKRRIPMKKTVLLTILTLLGVTTLLLASPASAFSERILINGLRFYGPDVRIYKTNYPRDTVGFTYTGLNTFILLEQYGSTCGVTSAEMLLHYYGKDATAADIWNAGDIDNVELGSWPGELTTALNKLGVPVGWYSRGDIETLMWLVRENCPPIVLLRYTDFLHYGVVVGYDKPRKDKLASHIIIADPNNHYRIMPTKTFLKAWSLNKNTLDGGFGEETGFRLMASKTATLGVSELTYGRHWITPEAAPTHHFEPDKSLMRATMVRGDKSWNPLFKTRHWERTFDFPWHFRSYRVSAIKPWMWLKPSSYATRAYMNGAKADWSAQKVKAWGRIEHGKITRGLLWLMVRVYHTRRKLVPASKVRNYSLRNGAEWHWE